MEFNHQESQQDMQVVTQPTIEEVVGSLNKTTLAGVRRIYFQTKQLHSKAEKTEEKIEALTQELKDIKDSIQLWETPVKGVLQGYSVGDIINYLDNIKKENEEDSMAL